MTQLIVLPHVENCPDGAVIEAEEGKSICENLLANGIELDHACEMSCACTTCHVIVREGFNSLEAARRGRRPARQGLGPGAELAPGLSGAWSATPLVVEIPKYSINMAKEGHRK
jgi:2Fe-2S ferredoxin